MSLVPPRYELPIIDPASGRMSREWYKYLVQIGNSLGGSSTSIDDVNLDVQTSLAAFEGVITQALSAAQEAQDAAFLLQAADVAPTDLSLIAWWPQ